MASASSTWVGGQFQANSHWSLEDDASAVSAFSAWVASSWLSWVDEMQGGGRFSFSSFGPSGPALRGDCSMP